MLDDTVQVGILRLQQLRKPVLQLDIRVAAHFAKHGGALDGLVGVGIELAEKRGAADFAHATSTGVMAAVKAPQPL